MAEAFICDYVRTPIVRFCSALFSVRAEDLSAIPLKALMLRNASVDWSMLCSGEDNRNIAPRSLLLVGLPKEIPG